MSMRGGMLFSSIAPLIGTFLFFYLAKKTKLNTKSL